jgi:hydrogenase expression/formation protein HypE
MRELIEQVFLRDAPWPAGVEASSGGVGLAAMDDGAALRVGDRWLVVTTDSHVVKPVFFPGGDIGRLAVAGTVNDLAMMGATEVLALTCSVILEEGFPRADLERIQSSIRKTCEEAGAAIVTGDTKVMGRGELDGIVLNTTGIAWTERVVPDSGLRPGDRILLTGSAGDHGFAVLAAREGLALEGDLRSDVAPLNALVRGALEASGGALHAMKDPTRGGVSSALHEMAVKSGVGILVQEPQVPLRPEVRAASELLGIDPLLVANEGKALLGVAPQATPAVLAALRAHPLGRDAAAIGTCIAEPRGSVILDTGFGRRLLVEPEGDPLPRIC